MRNQQNDERGRWRGGREFGEGMAGQERDWAYDRSQADASRDWENERNRSGSQAGMYGQGEQYDQGGMGARGYDYGRDPSRQPDWSGQEAWRVPGPHTGRGPQGYRRSDERIKEDVCERLTQHGQIDASGIQIDVQDCEVILRGTVSDRRTKRMAEDVAEGVSGVHDVRNELRVGQGQSGSTPQGGLQQREAGSGNRS